MQNRPRRLATRGFALACSETLHFAGRVTRFVLNANVWLVFTAPAGRIAKTHLISVNCICTSLVRSIRTNRWSLIFQRVSFPFIVGGVSLFAAQGVSCRDWAVCVLRPRVEQVTERTNIDAPRDGLLFRDFLLVYFWTFLKTLMDRLQAVACQPAHALDAFFFCFCRLQSFLPVTFFVDMSTNSRI